MSISSYIICVCVTVCGCLPFSLTFIFIIFHSPAIYIEMNYQNVDRRLLQSMRKRKWTKISPSKTIIKNSLMKFLYENEKFFHVSILPHNCGLGTFTIDFICHLILLIFLFFVFHFSQNIKICDVLSFWTHSKRLCKSPLLQ